MKDKQLIHILQKYVSNYRLNLIEVNDGEDVTKFKSDLQIMFSMLKYRKDKRRLLEYTKEHKASLEKLDYESVQAMAVLLKTPQLLAKMSEKKGAEGIAQGIEKGIEQGIEQGKRSIIVNMLKKGFDIEMIAELSGLSAKEVQGLCTEL